MKSAKVIQCRSLNRAGVILADHPRRSILHRTDDRYAAGQGLLADHHHVHTERFCRVEFRRVIDADDMVSGTTDFSDVSADIYSLR